MQGQHQANWNESGYTKPAMVMKTAEAALGVQHWLRKRLTPMVHVYSKWGALPWTE